MTRRTPAASRTRPRRTRRVATSRAPAIGLTPDWAHPADRPQPRYQLNQAYADAVAAAGGLPLVLAYGDGPAVLDAYLDRLDGLVVTGGPSDIPPEEYGEARRPACGPSIPQRTTFERRLVERALDRGVPILGVCGGMQLLNVALGGTLFQDLKTDLPPAGPHEQAVARHLPSHPVEISPGSLLARVLGAGPHLVNSTHHQAVRALGRDLKVTARAPDGVVEAVESTRHPFAVGVQWHPETLRVSLPVHLEVYRALVLAARGTR